MPRVAWRLCRALASIFFLALLILALHHDEVSNRSGRIFVLRVFSTYAVTLAVSAPLLFGLDRFDLFAELFLSMKRAILVAFPVNLAATVVDGMRT